MFADNQINTLIRKGYVKGADIPTDPYTEDSPVQPGSLDLHIAGIYLPGASADQAGGENHPLNEYLLQTGETVLVSTSESLELPRDVGGFAFPPSRFAVRALLITNGGHVDPGYSGPLRFTVINMGHKPQKLEGTQRVGTLVLFSTQSPVTRGWAERTGKSGSRPNTEDLRYLCADFADIEKRAAEIAQVEVKKARLEAEAIEQRWNRRATLATVVMAVVIGIFGWYSPVAKLEMKVDAIREEFTRVKQVEKRLDKLESEHDTEKLAGRVESLEKRDSVLQKKTR